ncbi:MAG: phosphoribosylglycinamide formyltransferase [Coriobacteriales bacterium]|jgi:phosphoribosylglycinamide formyltransferase-1|nr:phosphoribosylglycinamide formyltransferase [Coriobacteriales bacterium]
MTQRIRIGVLLSGSGTNLQAIVDAIATGALDAEVVLVISSKPEAYGLKRAREAGIATIGLSREVYNEQWAADELIAEEMMKAGAEYVVMAGYMRMVTGPLLDAFSDRVINIHPALLPSFPGAHGIADAFAAGVKVTGVTIHFANARYDEGPIIAQRALEVHEDDTLESLEERIHAIEHVLYPQTLQLIAEGRVSIDEKRRVRIA